MKTQLRFFLFSGWLIPVALGFVLFARWISDIVVPTLKGGNFDELYDLHGIRYLDTTLGCFSLAFVWVTFLVLRWARKAVAVS
jgi:hypothetical protein